MKKTTSTQGTPSLMPKFGIVILFVVVFAAIFIPRSVKAFVTKRLSQATGLPVEVDRLHLGWAHSYFSLKGLQFLNPKGFPSAPLASLGKAKVRFSRLALLHGQVDLRKAEIDFQELRLVRNEAGKLNLPKLSVPASGTVIKEVVLNLGSVTYTDLSEKQPVQKSFDVGLNQAVYRNVKGIKGIMEIVNWEVLKRTGVDWEKSPAPPEIKPAAPAPAESKPAQPASSPVPA